MYNLTSAAQNHYSIILRTRIPLFSQKLMAAVGIFFQNLVVKNLFLVKVMIYSIIRKLSPKNTFLGDNLSTLAFGPKFNLK